MYKTVKTQTNLPVKICHLKVTKVEQIRFLEFNFTCKFHVNWSHDSQMIYILYFIIYIQ